MTANRPLADIGPRNPTAPEPTAAHRRAANASYRLRYFEATGYAVVDSIGSVVEARISTPEQAEARRLEHAERTAWLRAWDDAHRDAQAQA